VVNLEKRKDRLETFMAWASKIFDVRVFKAIEGAHSPSASVSEIRTACRKACAESHIGVLEEAIREGVYPFVIFEDDAEPCGEVDMSILNSAPEGLLYLGALPVKVKARVPLEGQGWCTFPSIKLYGTHAIAYRKETAEKVLEWIKDRWGNSDTKLVYLQRYCDTWVYLPLPFKQAPGYSDIEKRRMCRR